jgi:hypothetical protein
MVFGKSALINTKFVIVSMAVVMSAQAAEFNLEPAPLKRWSLEWGWNNETYAKSDIHFTGKDHDFTLWAVNAKDTQKTLTPATLFNTYLNPGKITIPQTNFRLAYQYSADTAVALNLDHMKYVVSDGQTVAASGRYLNTIYPSQGGTQYLSPAFMHYEHTDGLNVLTVEYEKRYPLDLLGHGIKTRAFVLGGVGVVIPKSNVTLNMLNQPRNDRFHLAGTSVDVGTGLEFDFLTDFYARTSCKMGQVNLPDVVTSARQDKASQTIRFKETSLTVGMRF